MFLKLLLKTISCCIQINDSGLSGTSTYLALISMWREQLPIENHYYLTKIVKFSPFLSFNRYFLLNSCPFSFIKFTFIDYLSIICDWWLPNVCHYGENRKVLNKNRNFVYNFPTKKNVCCLVKEIYQGIAHTYNGNGEEYWHKAQLLDTVHWYYIAFQCLRFYTNLYSYIS